MCLTLKIEGQMTRDEALAVLNVTVRRPKWLLLQAHPDRHPTSKPRVDARRRWPLLRAAAMKRVNQAREIMCRHVTEVVLED